MVGFHQYADTDEARYLAAERFVGWLENNIVEEARGDHEQASPVDPTGLYWLGRLGPKDVVTKPDDRGDRLEPCAIGLRLRPSKEVTIFSVRVRCVFWQRHRAIDSDQRWAWTKGAYIDLAFPVAIDIDTDTFVIGGDEIKAALTAAGGDGLTAEVRVQLSRRTSAGPVLEITLVNTSPEVAELCEGRLFECSLTVEDLDTIPFSLEALPDSFRYDRRVDGFGINCGIAADGKNLRTSDSPGESRQRPRYWAATDEPPDLSFAVLAADPIASSSTLAAELATWAEANWSRSVLDARSKDESWSPGMREEAALALESFEQELARIEEGVRILREEPDIRAAFSAMNRAMEISSRGRYSKWRPFQMAFLLANLKCVQNPEAEADIVDVVWFATGGGKTETYLGLLITAAMLDRMRGKIHGVTAWSRFPLRLLSLQQTQRFANAIAAAELVRRELALAGDQFSLGFLVGGSATPNSIKKETKYETDWDADKVEELSNPFRLLEVCPFCRQEGVTTRFDRRTWRLVHECKASNCPNRGSPIPLFVIDDEIWRFLPTIVVGTLDKAANIARQSGMRGLVGAPHGLCSRPGHGFTYAPRSARPNGCLVPDCKGGSPLPLPIAGALFAPSFRLQDELHLLRDSLGAVDAHYESALDGLQFDISGTKAKVLASSATLAGYEKQIDVLYRRRARVFPQPAPREGAGFWTADSEQLMRRYVALAPRRLTVEFVVDRLVVSIQKAIRTFASNPIGMCAKLSISDDYAGFLLDIYGTNVVYGNTLQDIDAVVRSSETQYSGIQPPPNIGTLTGRTDFEEVRAILARLEKPEASFDDRLHIIAASSMMSHGVDLDRLNVMIMLAFPLGVAEFIQATARVGRKWPALVIVVPKMTRQRDASVYRSFPQFVSHGDRFVEPIPITRKSRRVLERTLSGLELARLIQIHEPSSGGSLTTPRHLNQYLRAHPNALREDRQAIARDLVLDASDEFMLDQLDIWFEGFARNLREPAADQRFLSDLSPTGSPMLSLRDVEEQAPVSGDSTK